MPRRESNPAFRPGVILLAALALSIGWGIRGNYGHELGAMLPGALAAIVIALFSGREDWRRRVGYFAFFGAIGWGFGGSMSYGMVLGYTHSGEIATQTFGFASLYLIGFLWAALGGAATALPAVLDRRRLVDLFRPLAVLFAIWAVLHFALPWVQTRIMELEGAEKRHESALYWFDSDWLEVLCLLVGLCVFDWVDRRCARTAALIAFAALGALAGLLLQLGLAATGLDGVLVEPFVRRYGDLSQHSPEALVANWPNFVFTIPQHVGWMAGLVLGLGAYFVRYGAFRRGSGLFVAMAVGWFAAFVTLPVLLDLRMTPPRSDNWAGVLGTFLGACVYFARHRLYGVLWPALVCGTIGGLGFAGATWIQLLLVSIGNPGLVGPEEAAAWQHWRSTNWHSVLEQTYGFINGLGMLVAFGLLAPRIGPLDESGPRRRWTLVFALMFVVPTLVYVNLVKNVGAWTREIAPGVRAVPETLKMPFVDWSFSAGAWFNLFFAAASLVFLALLWRHLRRRLAIFVDSALVRGQMLFLLILWIFTLGDLSQYIPSFAPARLVTEGVIFLNSCVVTFLVLALPARNSWMQVESPDRLRRRVLVTALLVPLVFTASTALFTATARGVYGDASAGFRGPDLRFGPEATQHRQPLLKGKVHK